MTETKCNGRDITRDIMGSKRRCREVMQALPCPVFYVHINIIPISMQVKIFFFSHKYVICQYKNALCEVCMKISSIDSLKNFIEHGFKENSFLNSMFPWSVWSQILLTVITHQLHHLIIITTPSINHKMMLKKGIIIHPQVECKKWFKKMILKSFAHDKLNSIPNNQYNYFHH